MNLKWITDWKSFSLWLVRFFSSNTSSLCCRPFHRSRTNVTRIFDRIKGFWNPGKWTSDRGETKITGTGGDEWKLVEKRRNEWRGKRDALYPRRYPITGVGGGLATILGFRWMLVMMLHSLASESSSYYTGLLPTQSGIRRRGGRNY